MFILAFSCEIDPSFSLNSQFQYMGSMLTFLKFSGWIDHLKIV